MAGQDESIYNIIVPDPEERHKSDRHVSKFRGNVKLDAGKDRATNRTMGPARVARDDPQNFLKKHTNDTTVQKKKTGDQEDKFHYPDEERRKPMLPKRDDQPMMGIRTNKNFISQNAVQNIMSVPKKPEKNFVDSKKGDKWALDPSGLEPKYINKKEFGETPEYLKRRQTEMKKAQEEYDAYVAEHMRRGAMQRMPEEERTFILQGLRTNWENLQLEYQGLSVVTDTASKKSRKERLEKEMKALEKDIDLIDKHRVLYIAA